MCSVCVCPDDADWWCINCCFRSCCCFVLRFFVVVVLYSFRCCCWCCEVCLCFFFVLFILANFYLELVVSSTAWVCVDHLNYHHFAWFPGKRCRLACLPWNQEATSNSQYDGSHCNCWPHLWILQETKIWRKNIFLEKNELIVSFVFDEFFLFGSFCLHSLVTFVFFFPLFSISKFHFS